MSVNIIRVFHHVNCYLHNVSVLCYFIFPLFFFSFFFICNNEGNSFLWRWIILNCVCGMVDRRKAFSLVFSRDHCQRSSPSLISNMSRAGLEPAQNLSSGLFEWNCAILITIAPRQHLPKIRTLTWLSTKKSLATSTMFGWSVFSQCSWS